MGPNLAVDCPSLATAEFLKKEARVHSVGPSLVLYTLLTNYVAFFLLIFLDCVWGIGCVSPWVCLEAKVQHQLASSIELHLSFFYFNFINFFFTVAILIFPTSPNSSQNTFTFLAS